MLSDYGIIHHIYKYLFTDYTTGNLCLGTASDNYGICSYETAENVTFQPTFI